MRKELLCVFFCLGSPLVVAAFRGPTTAAHTSSAVSRLQAHNDQPLYNDMSRRHVLERAAGTMVATGSGLLLPRSAAVAEDVTTTAVPTVTLGKSNLRVSRTIQGYWQLAGSHGRYREADAIANMQAHYAAGITTLDSADIYGPSELIVGKFVNSLADNNISPPVVPCTKFCCFRYLEDISREEVKSRIQRACERLQVSKLPLVQFFWSNYSVKR